MILTPDFEIVTDGSITRAELADALDSLDVELFYQSNRDKRIFKARTKSGEVSAQGELAEQIEELEGVEEVDSVVLIEEQPDTINPGDVNFPLQFYHLLTRLPDAWEQVEADPARRQEAFGSADVVVCVHDSGIRTAGAFPAGTTLTPPANVQHNEFQGNVTATCTWPYQLQTAPVHFAIDFP